MEKVVTGERPEGGSHLSASLGKGFQAESPGPVSGEMAVVGVEGGRAESRGRGLRAKGPGQMV